MLIGEVAKLANLSKDGIRHYEQLGLIKSTPRGAGSRVYRDYDPSVVETIENIYRLQQLGYSLKELVPLFETYAAAADVPREKMIEFLEDRLAIMRGKIASLQEVEAYMSRKLEFYRSGATIEEKGPCTITRANPDQSPPRKQ